MISAVCWALYAGVCIGAAMITDREAERAGFLPLGRALIALAALALAPVLVGMSAAALLTNLAQATAARR